MRRPALLVIAAAVAIGALLCSTAPALSGGLLFNGAHLRNFAEIQAAPHAITEVPDPLAGGDTVLKLTVHDQDVAPVTPTENPRAQAITPSIIEPGDEFWLRTEFLIPEDFPRVSGWLSLVSVYGPPYDGSSPWQVSIAGSHMLWERNENYRFDTPWKAPLIRGRWVSVLLHERFGEDGWVQMWIDGRPITFFARGSSDNRNDHAPTRTLEMETADRSNDGGRNSVRIAQYREEGMFETGTVYFRELKIGRSRDSVGG